MSLEPPPGWSFSATWSHGGGDLLVVDAARRGVSRYGLDGRRLESWSRPGAGRLDASLPSQLFTLPGGYLLIDRADRLLHLDLRLEPFRSDSLGEPAVPRFRSS